MTVSIVLFGIVIAIWLVLFRWHYLYKLVLAILILAAPVFIGLKAYYLYQSGPEISAELVSPAVFNRNGQEVMRTFMDEYYRQDFSYDEDLGKLLQINEGFVRKGDSLGVGHERLEWVTENNLTGTVNTLFRGRYLHHYSTILSPAREFSDGNYRPAFISQYGIISVLPLMLMPPGIFVMYVIGGFVFLVGYFLLTGLILRKYDFELRMVMVAVLSVALLFAFSLDVVALRLSPGFSFYRYLPIFVMVSCLLVIGKDRNVFYFVAVLISAALNSMQYNILFAVIVGLYSVYYVIKYRQVPWFEGIMGIEAMMIILIQYGVYYSDRGVFDANMFASVGAGATDFTYTLILTGSLFFMFMISYVSDKIGESQELNPDALILAYISAMVLSLYPLSFAGSSGHYSGFILTAMAPVSFMLVSVFSKTYKMWCSQLVACGFALFLLFWVCIRYGLFFSPQPLQSESLNIYNASPYGTPLTFRIPNNLRKLDDDFSGLMRRHHLDKSSVYFISKDKPFLELLEGHNYLPVNFDPFVNIVTLDSRDLLQEMRRKHIEYIVLDSPATLGNIKAFVKYASGKYIEGREGNEYVKIIEKIGLLSRDPSMTKIEDSGRWSLYHLSK